LEPWADLLISRHQVIWP